MNHHSRRMKTGVMCVALLTLLAVGCTTQQYDSGIAITSISELDAEHGLRIELRTSVEAGKVGFAASLDHQGDLVEIGPRVTVANNGEAVFWYYPSKTRPDLIDQVAMVAVYIGDQAAYFEVAELLATR